MSKTTALRRAVRETISQYAPHAYYGQAKSGHGKDYAVYELSEVSYTDNQYVMRLEVNCMGYGSDTSACENMADQIQKAFDHNLVNNDEIMFISYIESRQPVYEEDRNIIRRRLLFEIHLYERG